MARLEPHRAAGRLDAHRRLRGADPLPCLGNGPGRLARIVARQAAELGRGIAVGALLGQDLGKELAVADLVGIEPHGILGVALGLVQPTKRQQGAGAVLVGRIVPGALGKDRIGLAQHEVVIASLEGCGHIVQTDRGHSNRLYRVRVGVHEQRDLPLTVGVATQEVDEPTAHERPRAILALYGPLGVGAEGVRPVPVDLEQLAARLPRRHVESGKCCRATRRGSRHAR